MSKVIFITGSSKGFGNIWAKAALERGYRVAASARNLQALDELVSQYGDAVLPLELDVTNRQACFSAVQQAYDHFGQIDVLISNAGYGHFGFVEEITEEEARQQMDTNVFGSLWIIQAVLPLMRAQMKGHIIQVSSIGGVMAFPSLGMYHASKWAMEGLCEALSQEARLFNIDVTLIEPGGYSTDWGTTSAVHSKPIDAYQPLRDAMSQRSSDASMSGKPEATADAILAVIEAQKPPLRLLLGNTPWRMIEPTYQQRLETWKTWQSTSEAAQG
jgi:NADP-dependent 3-hydroxy acid dehydrogenase YdfG